MELDGIRPEDVSPYLQNLLGGYEREKEVGNIIILSQKNKAWDGITYQVRAGTSTYLYELMAEGIVEETRTAEGWKYSLTPRAIQTLYRIQTTHFLGRLMQEKQLLERKLEALERPFWHRMQTRVTTKFRIRAALRRHANELRT